MTDVEVMPAWSKSVVANVEDVDTWTRYDDAPADAFHVNVGVLETLVEASNGETCVGAGGGLPAPVVKLNTDENALVPPAFAAFARQ